MKESKTDLAVRIYDTSDPPVSAYRAAVLAGISPVTLYQRLARRERLAATQCPLCHRYPGQREWKNGKPRDPTPPRPQP